MRALALVIAALLPVAAAAEPVVLRIEAKRGDAAQAAAQGWRAQFPDVVTFPLTGGWTAIALGPMEREAAQARLTDLKAAGTIPADSFIAPQPEGAAPLAAAAQAAAPTAGGAADAQPTPAAGGAASAAADAAGAGEAVPAVAPASDTTGDAARAAAPGSHISLQSLQTRDRAEAALADWRKDFPEAGLWELPNGRFAVTLGPLAEGTAKAWLDAFKAAGRAPKDAFVASADKLGRAVDPGRAPDLPPPGSAGMPPLDQVQRALRWAGVYDGPIDGKDGPKTRDSIAAEIVAERAAPDAASAMRALIDRREAWRAQMGLTRLDDPQSGLSALAPMDRLEFERNDQGLSIYGPRDGSGAALILYSAPGGQQEMLDFTGLVTALGWVPQPERRITPGHASLIGRNDTHIGQTEARAADGRVEGVVLIWPVMDAADQPRIAAELIDSLTRTPAPDGKAAAGN